MAVYIGLYQIDAQLVKIVQRSEKVTIERV